jgi:hypothetical protein
MKAKTNVKAGQIVIANLAINASRVHQFGFANLAYVSQTAVAGNFV